MKVQISIKLFSNAILNILHFMAFVAPYGRGVMGGHQSQCCAPLRALALGYGCRALRALATSRPTLNTPSWGT